MTVSGRLCFDLRGWWHVGTGQGRGAELDAVVRRSAEGLPIIPGRTVKGLVRDVLRQAEELGRLPAGATDELCGSPLPPQEKPGESDDGFSPDYRFGTKPGCAWFGDAELGDDWKAWATVTSSEILDGLYDRLYATAINEDTGQVKDHSLRCIEVAAPMVLQAPFRITGEPRDWRQVLETAVPLLRALGVRRNRGLGRVRVTVEIDP